MLNLSNPKRQLQVSSEDSVDVLQNLFKNWKKNLFYKVSYRPVCDLTSIKKSLKNNSR